MYYSATGTGYISTPSFAIPNTGILTVEAWMKSVANVTASQTIVGESVAGDANGYLWLFRWHGVSSQNDLGYGISSMGNRNIYNFFQNLDNQWIHIVLVCDYSNKTLKAYRNGVLFWTDLSMTGTPIFPLTSRVRYIGSYNSSGGKLTDGSLDEVRIYNRGLGADEVAARYNSTRGRYQ